MRSACRPGIVLKMAHGSRAEGICSISLGLTTVEVPVLRLSSTGVRDVTTTRSTTWVCTMEMSISMLAPVFSSTRS